MIILASIVLEFQNTIIQNKAKKKEYNKMIYNTIK